MIYFLEETSELKDYPVKLSTFQGPFDLLLHLIDEGELGIYEVSLSELVSGYLKYLKVMHRLSLTFASEFLILAAYLIEMKSRMLLPHQVPVLEEEKEREIERTLLEHLAEYKVFKEAAQSLKAQKDLFERMYSRYSFEERLLEEVDEREIFLTDITLRDLVAAFQRVWQVVESREKGEVILDEEITVKDKIAEILKRVKEEKKGVPFEAFFTKLTKHEVIVTFLAILELARQKLIKITQGETFGSILIAYGRA